MLLLLAKYRPRNQINSNQPDFGIAPQVYMVSTCFNGFMVNVVESAVEPGESFRIFLDPSSAASVTDSNLTAAVLEVTSS